jgi:hypothetical protein
VKTDAHWQKDTFVGTGEKAQSSVVRELKQKAALADRRIAGDEKFWRKKQAKL